jgi:hydroxymethylglutaryl-CoA lyase
MKSVRIVEVGMRDGLQNETMIFSIDQKFEFFKKLSDCGFKLIEVGAFVRSEKVPQMNESGKLIEVIKKQSGKTRIAALVPNEKGMMDAIQSGVDEIAIFTAASETFCQKNINCSIDDSFERFKPVIKLAKKHKIKIRGYLSTAFACPFEGAISTKKATEVATRLYRLGCYEISVGDTIGVADPSSVEELFKKLKKNIPVSKLAGHFHDTRGTALANIFAAYKIGVRVFDSSIGALGGCPYAPGATGNVATEDVVYMFEKMGVKSGLNLQKLISCNHWLSGLMNKPLHSKVSKAGL